MYDCAPIAIPLRRQIEEPMNNIAGLAVFAVGIVLLIFGFNESQPANGSAGILADSGWDQAIWLITGGGAAVVGGLILAIRSRKT